MSNQKKWLNRAIGVFFLVVTVIAFIFGNENVIAPLVTFDMVLLAISILKPEENSINGRAAHRAIVIFGCIAVLFSVLASTFIPLYADQWDWVESHPNDPVKYPIVNDGIETCYTTCLLFVFYFASSGYYRLKMKK